MRILDAVVRKPNINETERPQRSQLFAGGAIQSAHSLKCQVSSRRPI